MSDIFREVEEEVRKERFAALWRRYGIYLYFLVGALVVGTGLNAYWRHYKAEQRLEDSTKFQAAVAALGAERREQAIEGFAELAANAGTGYAVLARLRGAAARAEVGDLAAAVEAWDSLAADDGVRQVYRDLARLLAAMHLVEQAPAEEVRERLAPLTAGGNPWRFSARELEALVALRAGDTAAAREQLQRLVEDAETPSGVRARASELLSALESQG